jgi:hypothetical protein
LAPDTRLRFNGGTGNDYLTSIAGTGISTPSSIAATGGFVGALTGNASTATALAPGGTSGQHLISNGGSAPTWQTLVSAPGAFACGALTVTGDITATGNITAYYSDSRLKTNIQSIPNALDKLVRLRGVIWDWDESECERAKFKPETASDIGLIAQEVQGILPTAVGKGANPDYLAMKTSNQALIGLLVEAVKELKGEVDYLKAQVVRLTRRI